MSSPVARTILRRLGLGVLTLAAVSVVVFFATEILPGDAARAILGQHATPERLAALRSQLHLDRPAVAQYASWLAHVLTGDAGTSLASGTPVWDLVRPALANSLALLVASALVSIPVSLALGVWAAWSQGGWIDVTLSTVALMLAALPEFAVGVGLVVVFSTVVFHWLPPVSLLSPGASILDHLDLLVLPSLTLALVVLPYNLRMMRATMIEVLRSEYFEMGRLKGLGATRLILVHALPNALPPTLQVIALTLAYLAGGVVVVEYVFGFPGIGQKLVSAIVSRDIPTIQLVVVVLAGFYVVVNLMADIAVAALTPKLRTSSWQA